MKFDCEYKPVRNGSCRVTVTGVVAMNASEALMRALPQAEILAGCRCKAIKAKRSAEVTA